MPDIKFAISNFEIMFVIDGKVTMVGPAHPMYTEICNKLQGGDKTAAAALIDAKKQIEERFVGTGVSCSIVERHDGIEVVLDGKTIKGKLAAMITDCRNRGIPFKALVNFWGKWSKNPVDTGRDSLITFLEHNAVPLLPNGNFVAYKGVYKTEDPFVFRSTHDPKFLYELGKYATLPRDECTVDVTNACGPGLHVGGFSHAAGYGDTILEIEVNPVDVVSVPNAEHCKMRACKVLPRRVNNKREPIESEYIDLRNTVIRNGGVGPEVDGVKPAEVELTQSGGTPYPVGDTGIGDGSGSDPKPKVERKGPVFNLKVTTAIGDLGNKIGAIKILREKLGLSLADAKTLVERFPTTIETGFTLMKLAGELAIGLKAAGVESECVVIRGGIREGEPVAKKKHEGGKAPKTTWYKVVNGRVFRDRKVRCPGLEWSRTQPQIATKPAPAKVEKSVPQPKPASKAKVNKPVKLAGTVVKRTYYRTLPGGAVETCRAEKRPPGWTGERPDGFTKKQ